MNHDFSLLSGCTSGGCGAKINSAELTQLLHGLPKKANSNLLVGFDASDDAAVYRINDTQALVSTVDFFPPMVADARTFGRIAAANALSDVWAMGAKPLLALNLVCFPENYPLTVLQEILAGGAEKVAEAGAVIGGGHSIYDKEPKYGLAVNAVVEVSRIIRNNTPQIGDKLILTKPLGTGIIMAAARVQLASEGAISSAIAVMERLNRYAAEKMLPYTVHACTDVTGFGLLSHLLEMRQAGGYTIRLDTAALPLLQPAIEYADEYILTAAGQRNRNHVGAACDVSKVPFAVQELLFDPQTSGGLLISVAPHEAQALLADIQTQDPAAAIIGEVLPQGKAAIQLA